MSKEKKAKQNVQNPAEWRLLQRDMHGWNNAEAHEAPGDQSMSQNDNLGPHYFLNLLFSPKSQR